VARYLRRAAAGAAPIGRLACVHARDRSASARLYTYRTDLPFLSNSDGTCVADIFELLPM
jgi:hypothetical protein